MNPTDRKAALEAIIYAADEPATLDQLAAALGEDKLPVKAALDELIASYASDDRGIEIRAVAGGYKMYTKPQHHDVVRRFIKSLRPPLRLSMPALETLAVIAYKQPVTAPEISEIRSVNTSGVISTLLDKKLITTAGRKEVIGRPILYKTSKEFLMRFGLSDLDELPSLKEFEALAREALGSDIDANHQPSPEEPVSELHPETDVANSGNANVSEGTGGRSFSSDMNSPAEAEVGRPGHQPRTRSAAEELPSSDPALSRARDSDPEPTPTRHSERSLRSEESLLSSSSGRNPSTISETLHHVEQELSAAEELREEEAAATSEGMPSGQLDEDPPPPRNAKSHSASD